MNTPLDFVHKYIPGTSGRTLLLLHGTGGSESDMVPLGKRVDPTAALLSPFGKAPERTWNRTSRTPVIT